MELKACERCVNFNVVPTRDNIGYCISSKIHVPKNRLQCGYTIEEIQDYTKGAKNKMIRILNQTKDCVVNYENIEAIYVEQGDWQIRAVNPQDKVYILGEYYKGEDCALVFEWLMKAIFNAQKHPIRYIEIPDEYSLDEERDKYLIDLSLDE